MKSLFAALVAAGSMVGAAAWAQNGASAGAEMPSFPPHPMMHDMSGAMPPPPPFAGMRAMDGVSGGMPMRMRHPMMRDVSGGMPGMEGMPPRPRLEGGPGPEMPMGDKVDGMPPHMMPGMDRPHVMHDGPDMKPGEIGPNQGIPPRDERPTGPGAWKPLYPGTAMESAGAMPEGAKPEGMRPGVKPPRMMHRDMKPQGAPRVRPGVAGAKAE